MNTIQNLKYPPIKNSLQKKLPEHLIYKFNSGPGNYLLQDIFVLFKTKEYYKRCYMRCYPDMVHRNDKSKFVPSLYIHQLLSQHKKSGLGTKMLDFAQIYSKKSGCNGYFHLSASSCYTPNSIPHIFYGKYGMNTESQSINNKINSFISKNKEATYRDIENVNMYYPPIEFISWQDKIKKFFTSLIK